MQDIRKKHLNSKYSPQITKDKRTEVDNSISHIGLSGTEQRRPRFVESDDIALYRERVRERLYEEEEEHTTQENRPALDPKRNMRKVKSIFSYLFFFGIVFLLYYALTYVFDSATVMVTPNYKDVTIPAATLTLGDKGAVPYELATNEAIKTKSLPKTTTTTVDKKASGDITIYNNYSTAPQRLVKFTRFESPNKKIYKIVDSVTIPGKSGSTPGQINVKVVAESEGADYNVDTVSFTIPGFKGKEQFTQIYAKTFSAILGGSSGSKAIVAITDLNATKDELAKSLRESIKKDFSVKTYDKHVPLFDSVTVTITDNSDAVLRGDTDTYSAKAVGSMAVVEESLLSKFVLASVGDVDKNIKYRFFPSNNLTFIMSNETPLLGSSTLSFIASGNARVVWSTDYINLQDRLIAKSRKDFTNIIASDNTISSASVSIFPPWKSGFPERKESITVKEKLADYKK